MTVLTEALLELKNKLNLQYIDLEGGAVSLNTVQAETANLADIKTETCTSECVTFFNSIPHYVVPELPVPTGTITFGVPKIGYTAISQPFSYSGTDATHYTATVDAVSIGAVTSPIELTGLTPDTTHTIAVTPISVFGGRGTEASTNVTTHALDTFVPVGVGAKPIGVITFGTPTKDSESISQPFSYSGTGQLGFFAKIDNGIPYLVTSPIELLGLDPVTVYNIKVAAYNNGGIGTWYQTNVKTKPLPGAPLGTITFGTPTITYTTITQPFTYAYGDATSFTAEVNGSSIGTVTSPISLSGLTEDTEYEIKVSPINAYGAGEDQTVVRTTAVPPSAPTGNIVFSPSTSITSTSFVVNFTYTGTDATSFLATVKEVASVNGVLVVPYELTGVVIMSNVPVTSPFLVSGLSPASFYATSVTPVNSLGSGTTASLG